MGKSKCSEVTFSFSFNSSQLFHFHNIETCSSDEVEYLVLTSLFQIRSNNITEQCNIKSRRFYLLEIKYIPKSNNFWGNSLPARSYDGWLPQSQLVMETNGKTSAVLRKNYFFFLITSSRHGLGERNFRGTEDQFFPAAIAKLWGIPAVLLESVPSSREP